MRTIYLSVLLVFIFGCSSSQLNVSKAEQTRQINVMVDGWHLAASETNFESYFSKMSNDAIFIGTDATENWNLAEFKNFAKPYFNKGKAWHFTTLERHVFIEEDSKIAWFDELLNTQMGVCRGSGVVKLTIDGWKITHYVLSISIPNENVSDVVSLKRIFDTNLTSKYQ